MHSFPPSPCVNLEQRGRSNIIFLSVRYLRIEEKVQDVTLEIGRDWDLHASVSCLDLDFQCSIVALDIIVTSYIRDLDVFFTKFNDKINDVLFVELCSPAVHDNHGFQVVDMFVL